MVRCHAQWIANGVVSDSYNVRLVSLPVVKLLVYSIRGIRSILVGDQLLCSVIPYGMEHVLSTEYVLEDLLDAE